MYSIKNNVIADTAATAASAMTIFFISTFAVITIIDDPLQLLVHGRAYADKPEGRTEELWTDWTNSCATAVWAPGPR